MAIMFNPLFDLFVLDSSGTRVSDIGCSMKDSKERVRGETSRRVVVIVVHFLAIYEQIEFNDVPAVIEFVT